MFSGNSIPGLAFLVLDVDRHLCSCSSYAMLAYCARGVLHYVHGLSHEYQLVLFVYVYFDVTYSEPRNLGLLFPSGACQWGF
jgi:hypothetical protein